MYVLTGYVEEGYVVVPVVATVAGEVVESPARPHVLQSPQRESRPTRN
jgi:hypothetical protein